MVLGKAGVLRQLKTEALVVTVVAQLLAKGIEECERRTTHTGNGEVGVRLGETEWKRVGRAFEDLPIA